MKLTDHFTLQEFASWDGAAIPISVQSQLMKVAANLEVLRSEIGLPIVINSGYRSPAHNEAIGGARYSYHLRGMAADIRIPGLTPSEVFSEIRRLIAAGEMTPGGLKKYDTFVHYDIRGILVLF